jgi:signal transduction histidine kinase
VILRVTDQGSGIPSDVLPEVFKPFFTTRARGSGLGLSIVKNIIETHGGTINLINNAPPPGLTVEVMLPILREIVDEE